MSDVLSDAVPAGWEEADDTRPGEVIHPSDDTREEMREGDIIAVWATHWADGEGEFEAKIKLTVIGFSEDDDIFAIPSDESAETTDQIFRLDSDLEKIQPGSVEDVPEYDPDEGVLETKRVVGIYGQSGVSVNEAHTLNDSAEWTMHANMGDFKLQ